MFQGESTHTTNTKKRQGGSAGRWGQGSDSPGWAPPAAAPTCAGRPQAQVGGGGSGCGARARRQLLHHNIPRPGARGPRGRARSGGGARAAVGEGRRLGPRPAASRSPAPPAPRRRRPCARLGPRVPGRCPSIRRSPPSPAPPSSRGPRTHPARPAGPWPRTAAGRSSDEVGAGAAAAVPGPRPRGEGLEEAACSALVATLPDVLVVSGGNKLEPRCFFTPPSAAGHETVTPRPCRCEERIAPWQKFTGGQEEGENADEKCEGRMVALNTADSLVVPTGQVSGPEAIKASERECHHPETLP
ncbi:translation initiation factor IF-2-like [Moschus berezovskii]|uniref:translation initiation factor IF-2-like n=1 Tax=Moschus berezovskii TaxID=68408 RepID=UPI002443F2E4|nr:translation initiation factor IF-2-like [Moschus berezovskii]